MAKPRIIIADKDINYIIPLQQKFVEEYFEQIDLEIICEKNYFNQLFSTPQKADILIVSEEFYSPLLLKHNFGSIFLMTEQQYTEQVNEPNISLIYKYTSIRGIFNEIIGKSFSSLRQTSTDAKGTKIVLVYSACGGVGKTTLSMGISSCLNKNYKKVLYINAARLQFFQSLISNPSPISMTDIYSKLAVDNINVYSEIKHVIRNEGFSYIPPFKTTLMALGINYSIFEKMAVSAKESGDFDYIIIDADTCLDEDKTRLIDIADKVLIVTNQNRSSVFATNALISNINITNTDRFIFVCNNFCKENSNALIESNTVNKFIINDYVKHLPNYEQLKANDFSNESDIQKVAFLIS